LIVYVRKIELNIVEKRGPYRIRTRRDEGFKKTSKEMNILVIKFLDLNMSGELIYDA
jgi:hypothetical protein